jgi:DNA-binding transcriptional regulator YiaG
MTRRMFTTAPFATVKADSTLRSDLASSEERFDVAAIRRIAGCHRITQAAFARSIGVSVRTLEIGNSDARQPTGAAVVLLSLIARDPVVVAKFGDIRRGASLE